MQYVELCSMFVTAWMGGEFEGERIHVCVCDKSLCCSLETVTTLLIGSTPIQNKKLKKILNALDLYALLNLCDACNTLEFSDNIFCINLLFAIYLGNKYYQFFD